MHHLSVDIRQKERTMMRAILLSLLLSASLYAQNTGKIAGTIRDIQTGELLTGVNVMIRDAGLGAASDLQGQYFILRVPPGIYTVSASMIGYKTVTMEDVRVSIDRTTTLDFQLTETVLEIKDEIVIVAERPDVSRDKTSTSDVIRGDQALAIPGTRDLEAVMALSPDVVDGHFRGGRSGEELYTMSGMGVTNPLDNALAVAPILSAVEEIEIIMSGFSAKYGNAQSGVVNISLKEGNRSRWTGRAELRTRLPGYKHFGPSVWDPNTNQYLRVFDSAEKMTMREDSVRLWLQSFVSTSTYLQDTVLAGRIAHAMYMQLRRDYGKSYNNLWDYSAEFNAGGPLSPELTLFVASRYTSTWQELPAPNPDITQQATANLAWMLSSSMWLRLSGAMSFNNLHDYRALNSPTSTDYRYWIWDRVMGLNKVTQSNGSLGLRFTYVPSERTFLELKLARLITKTDEGSPALAPDRWRTDDVLGNNMWRVQTGGDNYRTGYMDTAFRDEYTSTVSVDGSFTSQVTNTHMLLGGFQLIAYDLQLKNSLSRSAPGQTRDQYYQAKPTEWALYLQDKMEFEGMIANVGIRYDVYNPNVEYFTNVFQPIEGSEKAKTPLVTRVQPRIGISFPVSVSTVFHMNYGSFLQRPPFQYITGKEVSLITRAPILVGNPLLKPQDTKSYDVGVTQGLGEGFTVDLSGYYKDVSNLIERAFYFPAKGSIEFYETYINRDYADIRGFRFSFNKRRGILTGSLNYNYQVATGKSSTPFDASPIIRENPAAARAEDTPSAEDILLDFDRTHNLVATIGVETPPQYGIQAFGMYPFERVSVGMKSFLRSGRPYTSDLDLGERFKRRTPMESNTDLKITKTVPNLFGRSASFYVEILNVFNDKRYAYTPVFRNPVNRNKFETDKSQLPIWKDAEDLSGLLMWDISYLIYDSSPRSITVGFVVNF
ncbi:MAG: TonB-dependent receptor [Ignavibacteria bacterium]|nr:TonB-dependent receptor [Ignavibacteria bacterium]